MARRNQMWHRVPHLPHLIVRYPTVSRRCPGKPRTLARHYSLAKSGIKSDCDGPVGSFTAQSSRSEFLQTQHPIAFLKKAQLLFNGVGMDRLEEWVRVRRYFVVAQKLKSPRKMRTRTTTVTVERLH